jgi:tetratricopeptide (TPR) repeat protein
MTDLVQAKELVRQGIAAAKAGQKDEAQQMLLQAVELDELNEQAWLWLSGLVETQEEKRICLENVLAINPDNKHAQAGLQWLQRNAPPQPPPSDAQEQQEQCPHCGAEIPPSGTACPHCGRPLLIACPGCGTYVAIEQSTCPDCGQALGDFHEGTSYYLALAEAYLERRRNDLVEEALARAEVSAGDDPEALKTMAALYAKIGALDPSIAAYERAIAQTPDDASLYASLGAVYRQRSELGKARIMYEKAEQLDGNNPALLFELAQLSYEESGPTPEVVKRLQKVIQKQSMNAEAFVLLGDVYVAQERYRQALQQYTHACQLTSSTSEIGQQARRKLTEIEVSASYTGEEWTADRQPTASQLSKRPGCVSVYALLTGIGAALGLLGILGSAALVFGSRSGLEDVLSLSDGYSLLTAQQFTTIVAGSLGFALLASTINLAIAIGLWNMKNWARIVEILRQGLGLLFSLLAGGAFLILYRRALAQYDLASYPTFFLAALFVGLIVQAYFIFWFVANRELFH